MVREQNGMTKDVKKKKALEQTGSIALEYVLVSTFATVIGMALLGLAGHILKQKVDYIMDKLSIEYEGIEFSLFEE